MGIIIFVVNIVAFLLMFERKEEQLPEENESLINDARVNVQFNRENQELSAESRF